VDVINIAADHQMFMTLTGELIWQRLRRSAIDFYSKNEKSLFKPPFRGLGGNVRTPSTAYSSLEGRGRLDIRHKWIFFRYLLRLRRYKRKSVEVGVSRRGVGHFQRRFQTEGSVAHQLLLVSE